MNIYKFNGERHSIITEPIILSPIQIQSFFIGKDSILYLYRYGIETIQNKLVVITQENIELFKKYFVNKDVTFIDLINIKSIGELLLADKLVELR